MTLSELQAAVYDECNYGSSPATAVTTRVTRFLNEGLRATLSHPAVSRLRDSDDPLTFASVASQARYTLPEAVDRVLKMSERTNDRALGVLSRDEYRDVCPDPAATTGTPTHYVPFGRTAVAVQPADASAVYIKSTSASDTGTVYVEGIRTGGYLGTASATMTGTTAAAVGSISDFIEITDFYISANAVGTVTLLEDSGSGTTLATIAIGAKRPRYFAFCLWPTPSAAVTYYVDARLAIVDLANPTDEPNLPLDFHPMLVAYAVMREREKAGDEAFMVAQARFQQYLSRLTYQVQTGDELPVVGRYRRGIGVSRLGGWFPADTWV